MVPIEPLRALQDSVGLCLAYSAKCFFPDVFVSLFTSGEVSGRIDENLKRLRIYYQDEGFGKMKQFSVWFPRMIYFGIMGYIVYTILSFYSGYYDSVFEATDF